MPWYPRPWSSTSCFWVDSSHKQAWNSRYNQPQKNEQARSCTIGCWQYMTSTGNLWPLHTEHACDSSNWYLNSIISMLTSKSRCCLTCKQLYLMIFISVATNERRAPMQLINLRQNQCTQLWELHSQWISRTGRVSRRRESRKGAPA